MQMLTVCPAICKMPGIEEQADKVYFGLTPLCPLSSDAQWQLLLGFLFLAPSPWVGGGDDLG